MNVITISREFGSGGRELGKRLADLLGYTYYDKEIEEAVAQHMNMDAGYVGQSIEQGMLVNIPLHFGRTLASTYILKQQVEILVEKQRVLKEIAVKSNCVIVGRAADVILAEYNPCKIFVYADMAHKVERCQKYAETEEKKALHELEREIRRVDARRADYHTMFSDKKWGNKENYHLCVNTSGLQISAVAPHIVEYTKVWFSANRQD